MEIQGSLRFTDRRDCGAFPVYDAKDMEVARIKTGRAGTRFTASDGNGALLCSGVVGWLGLSGVWRISGPDGPILTVRKNPLRARAVASRERGQEVVIAGSVWKRDFQVTDAAGTLILTAVPSSASLTLQPHEYVIQQPQPVLGLAEIVAIVATWRLIRKSENAAVAGVAATGAITAGS